MTQEGFSVEAYWSGWRYSDAWPHCPVLLWEDAVGPLLRGERLCLAHGEPRGPEEALRVVKWPLIHSVPFSLLLATLEPPTGFRSTDLWELYDGLHSPHDWTMVNRVWPWQQNRSPPTHSRPELALLLVSISTSDINTCLNWQKISFPSPAESFGQPGSSSSGSSHGVHRQLSGVWQRPVKPARSHRTAGHQCTRTGECCISVLKTWSLIMRFT